jgi:hypothetical protein
MHATIHRYDGVDQNRTFELTTKVDETLIPKLDNLPGFAGYCLIDADDGVVSSFGLFETREQSTWSTALVDTWARDENLSALLPNRPKITSGRVVAQSDHFLIAA